MKAARIPGIIVCFLSVGAAWGFGITAISQKLDYTDNYNEWLTKQVPPQDPNRIVFIPPWATLNNDDPYVLDHPPYNRGAWEDWGWTHELTAPAGANGILSATLTIPAWDVDAGMENGIYINGVRIGILSETGDWAWGTSAFTLPSSALSDLWSNGILNVRMDIDENLTGSRITLGSATLTVNYNVSGKGTPARLSVHRFWSAALQSYFYTAKESEKEKLISDPTSTWVYQGVEYQALPADFEPGSAPVYRFWSDTFKTHLYTIDPALREEINLKFPSIWTDQGEAFWAFPPDVQAPGTIPVYRFRSDIIQRYFYTINEAQKDRLILENSDVWTFEGIAWHAFAYQPAQ